MSRCDTNKAITTVANQCMRLPIYHFHVDGCTTLPQSLASCALLASVSCCVARISSTASAAPSSTAAHTFGHTAYMPRAHYVNVTPHTAIGGTARSTRMILCEGVCSCGVVW